MSKTNLAYSEKSMKIANGCTAVKQNAMPESTWNYIVQEMKNVFRFTRKETKWFKNCQTAKLIATIPFAASCDEPERTAIAHLCAYIAELRGFQKYCAHIKDDDYDIFRRLAFISTFEGGDQKIIEQGMNLLALIMVEGYHFSEGADRINGVYNPFVSGAWNYDVVKSKLMKVIDNITSDELKVFNELIGW